MSSSSLSVSSRYFWRWFDLALLSTVAVAALTAQDRLSPTTLASWKATGAAPLVAQDQGAIILPASAQLARTFPAGQLLVHMVSRPFFGAAADSCSALEVGPASLAFVRIETGGGMVLLGDKALPLPSAIALGADGRSLQPLDLTLSYDAVRNEATLVLDGASYTVSATTSAAQLPVAVSAGSQAGWTLDVLETSSIPSPVNPALSSNASNGGGSPANLPQGSAASAPDSSSILPSIDAAIRGRAFESAVSLAGAGDLAGTENAVATIGHYPANTAGWELEMAGSLVQLAFRLRGNGNLVASAATARDALQHLDRCVKLASGAGSNLAGNALEIAGFVESRFFGDLESAKASYQKALIATPNQVGARSALDRLLAAQASEQNKRQSWGSK